MEPSGSGGTQAGGRETLGSGVLGSVVGEVGVRVLVGGGGVVDERDGGGGGVLLRSGVGEPGVPELLADRSGVVSPDSRSSGCGLCVSTRSCGLYGVASPLPLALEGGPLLAALDVGASDGADVDSGASRGAPFGDFALVGQR